jgi:hypothetical protein
MLNSQSGNPVNLIGQRYGRLSVIERAPMKGACKSPRWLCECDCGQSREVIQEHLRAGRTRSCGCLTREPRTNVPTKHGHTRNRHCSPEYCAWRGAKSRCENQNHDRYADYGGRGIRMCERWSSSFEAFFADMGPRPSGRSLERINNNGHYEPGNCKWATRAEQERNKRARRR